jgi:hypothetical protein
LGQVTGELVKITQTGRAPTIIDRDQAGTIVDQGLSLDGDDLLQENSTDRFSRTERDYVNESSAWWQRSRTYTWLEDNDPTLILVDTRKVRLTGFVGISHPKRSPSIGMATQP